MKTIVITGGTDGIGAAFARHRLALGDQVAVVGRDKDKGGALAGLGAHFVPADLSLVAENGRVAVELAARYDWIDALVMGARYFRTHRHETPDGFEACFALEYLSRFVLGRSLLDRLERAAAPVVVNISGPGLAKPEIHWDDPGLRRGYSGPAAQMQAGRANDLLGLAFAAEHPHVRTRYVLLNPGPVATSFAGEYDPPTAAFVEQMKRTARPVAELVPPLSALINEPPTAPLSAFAIDRPVDPHTTPGDAAAAERLHRLTLDLLATGR
ncbi:SDR family NAD(P)-dependent oxidoreductase [Glycomyces arizonensis]|uniref:SDR family NAD(P)-dependent oxidoreductase n=1 Tax=Glycomyces arizonensis TaxID=256035 RepID=UPI000416B5C2|nr:SDR family NAD(P)-dependent oxidoreductase [Glycomyces arizonensis]